VTEKAFRLDFFIAIAALFVSVLTSLTLLYQTRVIADQYAATIWPYLSSSGEAGPRGLSMGIVNDGLGPALIQSAQLLVDGKPATGWSVYFNAIVKEPEARAYFKMASAKVLAGEPFDGRMMTDSLSPGVTIRPGDVRTLMKIDLPNAPVSALQRHTIALRLCYCSLNKSCWMFDTSISKSPDTTQPVAACTTGSSIASLPFTSPSVRLHKKSL
jgi:hypothetical protein